MQNFIELVKKLACHNDFEVGNLTDTLENDIQALLQKCPNLAYCKDFLAFQREMGGFLLYLEERDISIYSINSTNIFPLLTGEGELINGEGFMCIGDSCGYIQEGKIDILEVWAYKVEELPVAQKIYVSKKIGTWEVAYNSFTEMLEKMQL